MKTKESNSARVNPQWTQLLTEAVTRPGMIMTAYSRFHGYSLGNQIAAIFQCIERGIEPGPLATYPRWQELGRHVCKGQKALTLCQPVLVSNRDENESSDADAPKRTIFIWRPRWFVLAQTEGEPFDVVEVQPAWNREQALRLLDVTEMPFADFDGNAQGYSRKRQFAINPMAEMPTKTTFHEIAHILLGHTEKGDLHDAKQLPRSLRETEAEAVALLCVESLKLEGAEFCRGYIQHWLGEGGVIPETSAQRIFRVADMILKAGASERAEESDRAA